MSTQSPVDSAGCQVCHLVVMLSNCTYIVLSYTVTVPKALYGASHSSTHAHTHAGSCCHASHWDQLGVPKDTLTGSNGQPSCHWTTSSINLEMMSQAYYNFICGVSVIRLSRFSVCFGGDCWKGDWVHIRDLAGPLKDAHSCVVRVTVLLGGEPST